MNATKMKVFICLVCLLTGVQSYSHDTVTSLETSVTLLNHENENNPDPLPWGFQAEFVSMSECSWSHYYGNYVQTLRQNIYFLGILVGTRNTDQLCSPFEIGDP
ncbi:MAG: hypothetical protein K0U54_09635 [Bacteroidetes bacterium]|nr:hypothetical protein [Bacteroidota bacterium]